MAEFEFGGMTFKGGKAAVLLTALSTLGGASWAAFEFYKDYMDMKEVVQNIDVNAIESRNKIIETKLDEAIEYTRDIKSGLRDDIISVEKQADRVEDQVRDSEEKVRVMIDKANERFENKRDSLKSDTDRDMKELEDRLTKKLQRALDNPLAD
jgi:predicted  nucleic acid-binding Zn-ribbon protein|tara:strand:- start:213 stop:671 length:459 start_codon:yes stop_codon:yes gene_type:complete